jgi:hypothetical protein
VLEVLQNPVFIVFGSLTLMFVLPWLAHYWYKARKAELDASLKQEMLHRGMTAAEIVQVLEASSDGKPRKRGCTAVRCSGD